MLLQWKVKALFVISTVFVAVFIFYGRDVKTDVTLSSDIHFLQQSKMRYLHRVPNGIEERISPSDKDVFESSDILSTTSSEIQSFLRSALRNNTTEEAKSCCKGNKGLLSSGELREFFNKLGSSKGINFENTKISADEKFLTVTVGLSLSTSTRSATRRRKSKGRTKKSKGVESVAVKRLFQVNLPWLSSDGLGNFSGFSRKPYPPYLIKSNETYLDRIHDFNVAITRVKQEIQKHRGYSEWKDVKEPNELSVVWGSVDNFLEQLADHEEVITLVLPWVETSESWSKWDSSHDSANILIKDYFAWSASKPLCEWIETPGFTRAHYDAVYNRLCNTDVRSAVKPRSLEWVYFHGKPINVKHYWPNNGLSYPSHFYTSPPLELLYINILQDAIINLSGDVISGGVKVVPYTCSHDNIPTIPIEYRESRIYRDVFVMTQFWGTTYFHKMLEVMPRVAAYVEFLRTNPTVHIHAPEDHSRVSELLRVLGLDPERIVTGITRAKVVYLPQGTPCGFPNVHEIQILSHHYRNYIREKLPAGPRNRLVLIKRSGLRRFRQQKPIEMVLQAIATAYNLNFTLFADNPTPSLHTTMSVFNSALVVVGPHGAGLTNMIFSEPGTLIVEGVCNPPHVNLCMQFSAHGLGHRYHGIPSEGGCEEVVSVSPETIDSVVRKLIEVSNLVKLN